MSKFKTGDRVRVYGFWLIGGYASYTGVIVAEEGNGFRVKLMGDREISAHCKQLRQLKPRKKKPFRFETKVKWDKEIGSTIIFPVGKPDSGSSWRALFGKRGTLTFVEDGE